jgi:hypothetical protein
MISDDTLQELYCVLDALDECLEESIEELLKNFATLFVPDTGKRNALHLMNFSQTSPSIIQYQFSNFPRLDLGNDEDAKASLEQDVEELIRMTVKAIEEKHNKNKLTHETLDPIEEQQNKIKSRRDFLDDLEQKLLERSQGSFGLGLYREN